jgi:hypothetical protein
MTKNWRVAVGTPERVAEKIAGWCEEADSSRVICHHHIGDMPHWKVVKNMTIFAEEVIPLLRPADRVKDAGPDKVRPTSSTERRADLMRSAASEVDAK